MSLPRLSYSKIKAYSDCSFKAYCTYQLGLPRDSNTGSRLGSASHVILENLAENRRKPLVERCLETQNPLGEPSLRRLATKLLKQCGELTEENFEKVNGFLLVALENDFYGKGCVESHIEYEFDIKTDKYHVYGFCDRVFLYEREDGSRYCRILDFKTSKQKFQGSEKNFNLQALLYSLIVSKLYPDAEIEVEFLFLKFRKSPSMKMSFTQEQLEGFEAYLAHISEYLSDFGLDKALANMAASKGPEDNWKCGRKNATPYDVKEDGVTPVWYCSSRFPFIFFQATKEGEASISAYSKKELDIYEERGYTIHQRRFGGCPFWSI